jgi:hypothetical protein
MKKLDREYISSGWLPDHAFTVRDSRHAFGYGHRLTISKPSRDWPWFVGAVMLCVAVGYFSV